MRTILSALTLTVAFSASAFASGSEPKNACGETDKANWISQDDAKAKAVSLGLDVRQVKEEGGCFEIYAIGKDGAKVEKLMHPVTGEFVGEEAAQQ